MLEASQSMPPPGYALMPSGPFSSLFGPHYHLARDGVYAMLIDLDKRHLDLDGDAHGGMLITICDNANTGAAELISSGAPVVTVSLQCDHTGRAAGAGWIRAKARIVRRSGALIFTACELYIGGDLIMTSSAICKIQEGG